MKKTRDIVTKGRKILSEKGGDRESVTNMSQLFVALHKIIEKRLTSFDVAADLYEQLQISLAKRDKGEYNAQGSEKRYIFSVFQ